MDNEMTDKTEIENKIKKNRSRRCKPGNENINLTDS